MAYYRILKEGEEALRKISKPVDEITPRILTILDDMRETLIKSGGVGLAAPQVGILRRMFIIDEKPDDGHSIIEFINPKIIKTEGEQESTEACLSLPGQCGITVRPMTVTVEATDRNGKTFTYTGTELFGKCLCHEYDHLDGILYKDKAVRMLDPDEFE